MDESWRWFEITKRHQSEGWMPTLAAHYKQLRELTDIVVDIHGEDDSRYYRAKARLSGYCVRLRGAHFGEPPPELPSADIATHGWLGHMFASLRATIPSWLQR